MKSLLAMLALALTVNADAGFLDQCLYYRYTNCGIAFDAPVKFDFIRGDNGEVQAWWEEDCAAPILPDLASSDAIATAWVVAQNLPLDFPSGFSIIDLETGEPVSVTVSAGELVTFSVKTNKTAAVDARRAIRQELRSIRTNVNASIDAATVNIVDAQAINVSSTSSTAQVRSAVIDIRRELIDAAREQKATLQQVRDVLNQILASMKDTSTNGVP